MGFLWRVVVLVLRLIALPLRLTWTALVVALRANWWAVKAPFRSAGAVARAIGPTALLAGLVGIAVGLLFAPMRGADLRRKLVGMIGDVVPADDEVTDAVIRELANAPHTWHLPQPEVRVVAGTVVLSGDAPHAEGAAALERAASSVPGVSDVDARLTVAD
jgi:hypothetical protein